MQDQESQLFAWSAGKNVNTLLAVQKSEPRKFTKGYSKAKWEDDLNWQIIWNL